MKKLMNYLLVGCSLLPMVGCEGTDSNPGDAVEYFAVKVEGDDDWSFINAEGKVFVSDEYDHEPTAVIGGYFSVYESDGYTVYKFDEKRPKAVKGLEGLKQAGFCNEGVIGIVAPMSHISFANMDGSIKFTVTPIGGKEIVEADAAICDGLIRVKDVEDNYGFIDGSTGKTVIKTKYEYASPFSEGYALAMKSHDDDRRNLCILDKKGNEVPVSKKSIDYYSGVSFEYGVIPAFDGSGDGRRTGFLDTKGEFEKLPAKVFYIVDYNKDIVIYLDDDYNYGIMTRGGDDLVRPKYSLIRMIDGKKFLVCKNDKYMLIDKNGEKIESSLDDYDAVYKVSGKGFNLVVRDGSTYMLANYDGTKVGKAEFDDLNDSYVKTSILESDYFDVKAFVSDIVSKVNTNGIGNYMLGAVAGSYLGNPSDYTYRSYFTPDDVPAPGYRYTFYMSVNCSETIAYYYWDYYDDGYYFNSDSKVSSIHLEARPETDVWSEAKPMLIKAFEDKGFNETYSDDTSVQMSSNLSDLTIEKSGKDIDLTLRSK